MEHPMIFNLTDPRRIGLALSFKMDSFGHWSAKSRELLVDTFKEEYPWWDVMSNESLVQAAQIFTAKHEPTMKDGTHLIITRD